MSGISPYMSGNTIENNVATEYGNNLITYPNKI